jgi:hypothetical protein
MTLAAIEASAQEEGGCGLLALRVHCLSTGHECDGDIRLTAGSATHYVWPELYAIGGARPD